MTHLLRPHVYPQGIKLGVDVGTVRVGVAICDRDEILATPLKTLDRNPKKNWTSGSLPPWRRTGEPCRFLWACRGP